MEKRHYTSFADYKAAKALTEQRRLEAIKMENAGEDASKAWAEWENGMKEIERMYSTLMPEVGMGATEIVDADFRAKTVVSVIDPNTIVVAQNKVKCLDYLAEEYEILDELDTRATATYTRRESGRWVRKGQPDKRSSVSLRLGIRRHFIEPIL